MLNVEDNGSRDLTKLLLIIITLLYCTSVKHTLAPDFLRWNQMSQRRLPSGGHSFLPRSMPSYEGLVVNLLVL